MVTIGGDCQYLYLKCNFMAVRECSNQGNYLLCHCFGKQTLDVKASDRCYCTTFELVY